MDEDYQLALLLQNEFNDEDRPEMIQEQWNSKEVQKRNNDKKTESLVDPQWEFIDPTPDIHVLFLQFNDRFFWGKLHTVEVKWSNRMTSCAGVCVYQGRSGFCSVRLSLPLLKLRPRKDLVETLLHEMIHAFLFITKNNRDRDGHGPEFHKHMNRINQEAGTHISVYHSFHDEVRLYQQHWWRCSGPCHKRPPFFGMVRRTMNRAPGPADNWWKQHQDTCGGRFVKVREPENTKKKSSDSKSKSDQSNSGDIRSFFPTKGPSSMPVGGLGKSNNMPGTSGSNNFNNFPKVGAAPPKDVFGGTPQGALFKKPTMSNVHGFGGGDASSFKPVANPAVNNVFGFGDMQGQGRKQPTGSSQPSGKGYTLGGSGKPPYQRGGAYGGMLANKGGGTLVVSGTSNKFRDSPGPSNSTTSEPGPSSAPIQAFSGSGYVLGKGAPQKPVTSSSTAPGSLPKKPSLFPKSSYPAFTKQENDFQITAEPSKRLSPKSSGDIPNKKKLLDGESSTSDRVRVTCPVCNKEVYESEINSHLDECFNNPPPEADVKTDDVIVLSDDEDLEDKEAKSIKTEYFVECPGCNKKILESELDSHLSSCLSHSFDDEAVDDDVLFIPNRDAKAKCPICCESILAADMDKHLDNCASCSVQDLSNVFDEEMSDEEEDAAVGSPSKRVSDTGERLYPCPCCLRMIETTKMNDHLDQCNFF
ncbi:sprT-like domain-containing protein Spartan [Thrips palmi]|uniref:Protein with SprT-like domain at the N terminus n=1 Tax=Thrips palmi TaxID=161013 RepID=A0A6P9ACW2_THRPL|nr:sprT-like domain-containing protein Spartan [Thrips palmi]XP_034256063.1 sprT-like domain-containing protein Spartan [Thrips palmi]